MGKKFDPEKTVNLQWYTDSETSERILVDEEKRLILGRFKQQETCPLCGRKRGVKNG